MTRRRSSYTESIERHVAALKLATPYDAVVIEAWMRLEHGTLDALSPAQFRREVKVAIACIDATTPAENAALARSFGLEPK